MCSRVKKLLPKVALVASLSVLGSSSTWASIIGSTNPADFPDIVDWCQLPGACQGNSNVPVSTPQAWTSADGKTGLIGLANTGQNFFVLQQGVDWAGNFSAGMGLVYNGALFGNIPTQIASTNDQGVYGVGAYIQADYYGPFTATIELFDSNYNSLSVFTTNGYSDTNIGTALFIGTYDPATNDVYAAQFDVTVSNGGQDFAISTMGLMQELPPSIPEPTSLLLMAPGLLAMTAVSRRRKVHKTEEVN